MRRRACKAAERDAYVIVDGHHNMWNSNMEQGENNLSLHGYG